MSSSMGLINYVLSYNIVDFQLKLHTHARDVQSMSVLGGVAPVRKEDY